MTIGGSHAGPELMLRTISGANRFIEVPVNYLPRVGYSSVTGHQLKAIILGFRMILLIMRFRATTKGRNALPPRLSSHPETEEHEVERVSH